MRTMTMDVEIYPDRTYVTTTYQSHIQRIIGSRTISGDRESLVQQICNIYKKENCDKLIFHGIEMSAFIEQLIISFQSIGYQYDYENKKLIDNK